MAKVKSKLTPESAKSELTSVKEELEVAKTELKDFRKANKIGKDATPESVENKKLAKQLGTLQEAVAKKEARREELREFLKNNKPEPKERETKYKYPEEVKTSLDKKKFRATMRSQAKRVGASLDDYVADPQKYAKKLAEKEKEKAAKAKDNLAKGQKKKKKEEATEAPKKKLKIKKEEPAAEAPKKKLKKKAAPAPAESEENEGESED